MATLFIPRLAVLVVEDYPDAADSCAELLRAYGYRADVARTGEDALRRAADDPPDVALLDLRLPDLDGCEVARRLRDRVLPKGNRPLLIAYSGCVTDEDRRRTAAAGIDLHLAKGQDARVLIDVLRRFGQVLREPRRGASGAFEPWADVDWDSVDPSNRPKSRLNEGESLR
ncbi:MAG TPA: response regulator [Urbifossiella sp.]|nr:response regulator [Urbifossiella sp.]